MTDSEALRTPVDPDRQAPPSSRRLWWELGIVLLLSLGASALWSVLQFIDVSTRDRPIGEQQVALNPSRSDRAWLDLAYQLTGIALDVVPVALVCWLLWRMRRPHLGALGIDGARPIRDTAWGTALVLVIGVPGLALYFAGSRRPSGLRKTSPELNSLAHRTTWLRSDLLRAGLTEEVIVVGYLFERLRRLGWGTWPIILAAAALRGVYHLYQGVPGMVGNVAMGVLFGWLYARTGRLVPLIVAHTLIDVAVFVGYPWAYATFPALFGAS
ncbi:CPBP family intramembrane metalloprotease [Agrococcus terreus]